MSFPREHLTAGSTALAPEWLRPAEKFENVHLIRDRRAFTQSWSGALKRAFDVIASVILLFLFSPLMLLVAILIKLTSPGPALFRQPRLGYHRRNFTMYKFRTMAKDAEQRIRDVEHLNEVSGPVFKIRRDPRVTWIGRLLRRSSIDELPQLVNVLKGDMSLVGPRPLSYRDYEGWHHWQPRRFHVRPGMTCLWQIQGRSLVPFAKWMQLDLQYVDDWSLWLDFQILARTIPAVLKGTGAT